MEQKKELLTETVSSIMASVLEFADGKNPEGRDYFQEMDADSKFQKSYGKLSAHQKNRNIPDNEIVQAQLMSLMLEGEMMAMGGDNEYRYYDDDLYQSSRLLRQAGESEGPKLIKNHRRLQLSVFGKIASDKEQGLIIKHIDPEYKVSESESKQMKKVAAILANDFFFLNGSKKAELEVVLGAAYEDFFDLDKICFFVWRTKSGKPLAMILVDPELVKTIVPRTWGGLERWDSAEAEELEEQTGIGDDWFKDDFRFLLINKNKTKKCKFTDKAMLVSHFFRRSATSDLFKGNSIIAQAVKVITSIMNSMELNATTMTNNRAPQGVIALQGGSNVNPLQVEKFKKLLWAQTMGAQNRWRIPVIALPEKNQIQWMNFKQSNSDMQMFQWLSLLFTVLCRLSGTDPEELSLASNRGVMEGKGALFQQGQEGIARRSKDTGLRTYLNYFSKIVNDSGIISEIGGSPDWIMGFSGLDVDDDKQKADLQEIRLRSTASLNDLLTEEDKKKFDMEISGIKVGDVPGIGNQNIFQLVMMKVQEEQQEQMAEQQQEQGAMPSADGMMPEGAEGKPQAQESPEMTPDDMRLLQEYSQEGSEQKSEGQFEKAMKMMKKNYEIQRLFRNVKTRQKRNEIELIIED